MIKEGILLYNLIVNENYIVRGSPLYQKKEK